MGLMTESEMKALFSDLEGIAESAATHGPTHKQTKQRLEQLFDVDMSHGKYPLRSISWADGVAFNSLKVATGLIAIRQSFISAAVDDTLPFESFVSFSGGVLTAAAGASELRDVLRSISIAGISAAHRPPSFLSDLSGTAKIALVTELLTLVSKYQAVGKTDESRLERDHANADLAVAWLSLMVVVYETILGTTFPVAGLALIILRWVLFDQDLWDLITGAKRATPAMKMVHGVVKVLGDEKGEIGKLLRAAPNWGKIEAGFAGLDAHSPESIDAEMEPNFPLFFRVRTKHARVVRTYAENSLGLTEELAEVLIEE
jgi:hypothetical protein